MRLIGDVGTFVTLADNILQILISVKDFFASIGTTASERYNGDVSDFMRFVHLAKEHAGQDT